MLPSTGAVFRDPSGSSLFSFQMGLTCTYSNSQITDTPPKKLTKDYFGQETLREIGCLGQVSNPSSALQFFAYVFYVQKEDLSLHPSPLIVYE